MHVYNTNCVLLADAVMGGYGGVRPGRRTTGKGDPWAGREAVRGVLSEAGVRGGERLGEAGPRTRVLLQPQAPGSRRFGQFRRLRLPFRRTATFHIPINLSITLSSSITEKQASFLPSFKSINEFLPLKHLGRINPFIHESTRTFYCRLFDR